MYNKNIGTMEQSITEKGRKLEKGTKSNPNREQNVEYGIKKYRDHGKKCDYKKGT
jgi:hypothetical protein